MESRHEQWARESEEHTTTIRTQKLINLEKDLAAAKEQIKEFNHANIEDEEEIISLENKLAAAQDRISELERLLQEHQTNGNISETHRENRRRKNK